MKIDSGKGKLALLFVFGILLFAFWSNVDAYAQNRTAAAVNATSSSSPKPLSSHHNNIYQK
jgi:hypothetical protein